MGPYFAIFAIALAALIVYAFIKGGK